MPFHHPSFRFAGDNPTFGAGSRNARRISTGVRTLVAALVLLVHFPVMQSLAQTPAEIPLWPGGAPGAHGSTPDDIPSITPFLPDAGTGTGAAIVVCPGGGYGSLSTAHEGTDYAHWLNRHGIAAFVLRYRLGTHGYHHPAMLNDGARAVRYVRANAAQWQVDPHRIGMMGSSAGGHLTATVMTHFDAGQPDSGDPVERVSSRPDFGILCYAVITMSDPAAHGGSRTNLLGPNPSAELMDQLSAEKQVTADTPTCFIWHTWEDAVVKVENALAFAAALRAHGVRFDLHIYEKGAHGLGLSKNAQDPAKLHPWTDDCLYWLQAHGYAR